MIQSPEVALGDIATITMGTSPKGETYNSEGIGMPLLNGPTEFGLIYPVCTLFTTDSKKNCKKGDLIFCVRGSTTGRMNWADISYSLGRGVCSIRGATPMDTKYIRYCIELKLGALLKLSGGATFPNLTGNDLSTFSIPYPPHRHKIAAILSAYDELIENNTRRIKILEEMAQALYREWFVKFRFPGHEKVGMVESELGMVPGGWEVDSLSDHITLDKGISYKGEFLTDDGLPMVNLKCILPNGGFRRDGTKPYSGDYKPKHTVKPGDLVIANTDLTQAGNVIGSPAIVPNIKTNSDILISHHLYAIRFKNQNQIIRYFLYNLMQIYEFKSFAKGRANGTTVLGLAQDGVLDFSFAKPPTELLNQFEMLITPMYEKIEIHERKNDALRRTRDLLLPKLISGEVDVENIDVGMPQ